MNKNVMVIAMAGLFAGGMLVSCGGEEAPATEETPTEEAPATEEASAEEPAEEEVAAPAENNGLGIGPITEVVLGEEIDQAMVDAGKTAFDTYCVACHQVDEQMIGPAQRNVMNRHTPEWIMNFILNPDEMLDNDPDAMALLDEYNGVRMTPLGLTEEDARNIVEYFRTISE